ncbi:MAG: hypothetical protein OEV48_03005 [Acidobacteriota bacterium]|nr:hypothetical protein [Acidobacteriota bacterium]
MKKIIFVLPVILACALMVEAAGPKTLTRTIQAGAIETLDLSSGIGDVTITAREAIDEVAIEVVLTPRRGGIFSSKRQAERDVEAASLEAAVKHESLKLRISPADDDDRRFEEKWIIEIPSRLAIKLEHGVGDVVIRAARAGIELDSGVGDIDVEAAEGDITIDLGVGNAVVRAPAAFYASAEAAGGVGSARVTVRGEEIEGGGFVSHAASWSGDGSYRLDVSVGVGDAIIVLD